MRSRCAGSPKAFSFKTSAKAAIDEAQRKSASAVGSSGVSSSSGVSAAQVSCAGSSALAPRSFQRTRTRTSSLGSMTRSPAIGSPDVTSGAPSGAGMLCPTSTTS